MAVINSYQKSVADRGRIASKGRAATSRKGLEEILSNLNKEISKIEGDIQKGLTLGMQLIKAESMKNTPVDTGNLKASHYLVSGDGTSDVGGQGFTSESDSGKKVVEEHPGKIQEAKARINNKSGPFVELGCTAFYAEYVHEDLQASHLKAGPKGGPSIVTSGKAKFMEDAIKNGQKQLLETIKRYAKR